MPPTESARFSAGTRHSERIGDRRFRALGKGPSPSRLSATHFLRPNTSGLATRRLPARQVTVAGYLCQLLIQTLTHFEREAQLAIAAREATAVPFDFITHIPRPKFPTPDEQNPQGNRQ
jgi:hypothetical protein